MFSTQIMSNLVGKRDVWILRSEGYEACVLAHLENLSRYIVYRKGTTDTASVGHTYRIIFNLNEIYLPAGFLPAVDDFW